MTDQINMSSFFCINCCQKGIQECLALPENVLRLSGSLDMDADIIFSVFRIVHDLEVGFDDDREVMLGQSDGRTDLILNLFQSTELANIWRDLSFANSSRKRFLQQRFVSDSQQDGVSGSPGFLGFVTADSLAATLPAMVAFTLASID
jgi:hypothetical protein